MMNYVLVLILCGFLIREILSQDNRGLTFYPGQSSLRRSVSTESGPLVYRSQFSQSQSTSSQQGQVQIPHRNQYEVKNEPGTFDRLIRASSEGQYGNDDVNVPKVFYFGQSSGLPSDGYIQPVRGNQNLSITEDGPSVWIQRGSVPGKGNQIQDSSPKQTVTYFIVPSEETLRNNLASTLGQEQQSSQHQKGLVQLPQASNQKVEFIQASDRQDFTSSDRDRYSMTQISNNAQRLPYKEEYTQPYALQKVASSPDQYATFQITDSNPAQYSIPQNQYQNLPRNDRDKDQYSVPQVISKEGNIQSYEQRITPNQFQRPSNNDGDYQRLSVVQVSQPNPIESQIILSGPFNAQLGPVSGYQIPNQFQTIPGQMTGSLYQQQYPVQNSQYAQFSTPKMKAGPQNFQPSTQQRNQTSAALVNPPQTANTNTTTAALNPSKRPFFINTFAADLYITKKPCEVCCRDDELEPCHSCCNATALLNSRTLKTAVG